MCNQNKKLVKAHIIPAFIYRILSDNKNDLRLYSSKPGSYPKRRPIGEYDSTILCEDCEKIFGDWDDYAYKVLIAKRDKEFIADDMVLMLKNIDYSKIKLFFLSVLWRASVSKQEFFKEVNLGPYEDKIRDFLLKKEPGRDEDFSMFLTQFKEKNFQKGIFIPHKSTIESIRFYDVFLGEYIVHIKVDKRSIKDAFMWPVILRPELPIYVLRMSVFNTKEINNIAGLVYSNVRKN